MLSAAALKQVPSLSGRVCCIPGCTDLALAAPSVEWRQSAAKDISTWYPNGAPLN